MNFQTVYFIFKRSTYYRKYIRLKKHRVANTTTTTPRFKDQKSIDSVKEQLQDPTRNAYAVD